MIADYLAEFERAAAGLDEGLMRDAGLRVETGIWLESVVLRLQKAHWANGAFGRPHTGPGIFFSVWLNDAGIRKRRLYYNIHALKLRMLTGYRLTGIAFARAFRERFAAYADTWAHVNLDFGPLTLMEGWVDIDPDGVEKNVYRIARQFFAIQGLVDDLLEERKRTQTVSKTANEGA